MKVHKKIKTMQIKIPKEARYLIGIDEVGRGPIAGPVTLGAFLVPVGDRAAVTLEFRGVKESKQLTATRREAWFEKICIAQKLGRVEYSLASVGPELIDSKGLSWAIRTALAECLKTLGKDPQECFVLLDGSLKAPAEYLYQKTIIGGDSKVQVIALASIAAKVTRDRELVRIARKYPEYAFEIHKGYGTKSHYQKIAKYGICAIHRKSFLQKLSSR